VGVGPKNQREYKKTSRVGEGLLAFCGLMQNSGLIGSNGDSLRPKDRIALRDGGKSGHHTPGLRNQHINETNIVMGGLCTHRDAGLFRILRCIYPDRLR